VIRTRRAWWKRPGAQIVAVGALWVLLNAIAGYLAP
jgi:hypothetical protein